MSQNQPITEDLLWQAFQYVSGDLSDAECDAFELQMLADDGVCEAVAEATRLSSVIAGCEVNSGSVVVPAVCRERAVPFANSRAAAALVAICCCVVLILVLNIDGWNTTSSDAVVKTIPKAFTQDYSEAEQLVSAWAESVDRNVSVEIEPVEVFSSELSVPDWMLAAVTLTDIEERDSIDMPADGALSDDAELF